MLSCYSEVTATVVHLVAVWLWLGGSDCTGNAPMNPNMDTALTGRDFSIGVEALYLSLRPGGYVPLPIYAVIEVNTGNILTLYEFAPYAFELFLIGTPGFDGFCIAHPI